jgi:hypothetical protein
MSAVSLVLLPLGGVSMGARGWRVVRDNGAPGPLNVSVVFKATVDVDDEGRGRLVEPVATVDEPGGVDDDLAPYLGKAEIWLARSSEKASVTGKAVRLRVGRGSWVMLDRVVAAEGTPVDPARTASGFALPASSPSDHARAIVRTLMRRSEGAWPAEADASGVAYIPASADWTLFFGVPNEQRCKHLQGDEWILVSGMGAPFRCQLPLLRGGARVFGPDLRERGQTLEVVCDGAEVDVAARRCSLRWRGTLPVSSLEALAELRVAAAVSVGEQAFDWSAIRGDTEPIPWRLDEDDEQGRAPVEERGVEKGGAEQGGAEAEDTIEAVDAVPVPSGARDTVISSKAKELRERMGLPAPPPARQSARDAAARLAMSDTDAELVRAKLGIPMAKSSSPGVEAPPDALAEAARRLSAVAEALPLPRPAKAAPASPPRADGADRRGARTALQVGGDAGKTQPQGGAGTGASVGVRTMSGIGTPVSYAETEIDDSEKQES